MPDTPIPPPIPLDTKTTDARRFGAFADISNIAIRAIYEAAAAGNVRCREAVLDIEAVLRKHPLPPAKPPITPPAEIASPVKQNP